MTEEELGAFEKAARGHPFEAALCSRWPPAPAKEVLGLQWSRVDIEMKQIQIAVQLQRLYKNPLSASTDDDGPRTALVLTAPKTRKSSRPVPLCDAAVKALAARKMIQEADRRLASTRWQRIRIHQPGHRHAARSTDSDQVLLWRPQCGGNHEPSVPRSAPLLRVIPPGAGRAGKDDLRDAGRRLSPSPWTSTVTSYRDCSSKPLLKWMPSLTPRARRNALVRTRRKTELGAAAASLPKGGGTTVVN